MRLHQITHPASNVERKVNFFADYFSHLTDIIGKQEHLEVNNHLSIVEKILWQLETNKSNCIPYLDNYLNHPLLRREDLLIKSLKHHSTLFAQIDQFKAGVSAKAKKQWLDRNPEFVQNLRTFQKSLRRTMVKTALREIISFLRCVHDIETHQTEIMYNTRLIVTEFLLNGHTKKDLTKIFDKIITREITKFPFPKQITNHGDKVAFISNRTFNQQFEGIVNLLKADARINYFIYRITGIKSYPEFKFQYDQVIFYHPQHGDLTHLRQSVQHANRINNLYFSNEHAVIAIIKARYQSQYKAETQTTQAVSEALSYLNFVVKSNGFLDRFEYLISADLISFEPRLVMQHRTDSITPAHLCQLTNNPHHFLKRLRGNIKIHFLKYEGIFRTAMSTRNVEDFWQYLEALIPNTSSSEKQVIEVVALCSLQVAEKITRDLGAQTIAQLVMPFSLPADKLGLTQIQQMRYYRQLQKRKFIDLERLKKEIKHPFISFLLERSQRKWACQDFQEAYHSYKQILYEAYAQRNAVVHRGEGYQKSANTLDYSFPWLVTRFRRAIFLQLQKKSESTFQTAIEKMKDEGLRLLSPQESQK